MLSRAACRPARLSGSAAVLPLQLLVAAWVAMPQGPWGPTRRLNVFFSTANGCSAWGSRQSSVRVAVYLVRWYIGPWHDPTRRVAGATTVVRQVAVQSHNQKQLRVGRCACMHYGAAACSNLPASKLSDICQPKHSGWPRRSGAVIQSCRLSTAATNTVVRTEAGVI